MKRNVLSIAAAVCLSAVALSSCSSLSPNPLATGSSSAPAASSGSGSGSSTAGNVLGSLLGGLIGNAVPVTEKSIVGTWVYKSPEVRFESENLLSKAGGEVAAASIEEKLVNIYSMIGIKAGESGFIFNEDKTCTIALGATSINGTYTLDVKSHEINIKSNTGLIKLKGQAYFGLGTLSIIFDADKLLSIAQGVAAFTGKGGGTLGTLSGVLGSYKGLMLGMELQKN